MEFCAQTHIDLVLMDMQMPIMDGLAATRAIRRAETLGRRVPILALTASAMTDELDRCLAAGMDGLLTKPLQPQRLREVLERHGLGHARDAARDPARTQPLRIGTPAVDMMRLQVPSVMIRSSWRSCAGRSWPAAPACSRSCARPLPPGSARSSKALAHKLKGGAGSVCAQRITDLSLALEHTALVAPTEELASVVEQLRAALGECASVIEVHFPC